MASQRVTQENFGSWIMKCNPAVSNLPELIEHGVSSWCVQKTYRTRLFEPGQPVLLWVSGSARATPAPGIWATGHVTGPADWRPSSSGEPPKYVVPLTLDFLPQPIPRALLVTHPALTDLEVLRQPQMSNPSFATRSQYAALQHFLRTAQTPRAQ
ncbi:EVE domain-containing protein [Kribbella sp. NPDC023855]|uniref:EVE domain-containing protein n=1 Tax=Kribbella sp. NPDC023855 TaxID=3154698 RepID=UPI0033EF2CBA